MTKRDGYWRTEFAVIEDRTDKGLGYATLWTTGELARARDHAELLLLDGKNVALKTREVFYTEWAPLPETANAQPEHETEERP